MVNSLGFPMLTGVCSAEAARPNDAVDEVRDVAEAARLETVAVDGQRLACQRLHHEV
jgi:hypothetical protein